jgi:hypothetical protein
MSTFLLGSFLILFGFTQLVNTSIPAWVIGLLALAAGVATIIGKLFPRLK